MPFKSLEEFKVTRAREVVKYKDSRDLNGRKLRAEVAVQEAEARMRQRSMVGVVTLAELG